MDNIANQEKQRKNRTICLPFDKAQYNKCIKNVKTFRAYLKRMIEAFPELFPEEIASGYQMKDSYFSKKLNMSIRRIRVNNVSYSVRPSFVMPYMTGKISDVEKALFLRKFSVPFWALAHVFKKNAMYWYRNTKALGRNSIVGTTINDPTNAPDHVCGDEKHTWINGQRVYAATTVGNNCILGVAVATSASEIDLTVAYDVFKQEALLLKPNYAPKTVTTDGWESTRNAWKSLFPSTTVILCFLHIFIGIRDRAKKKFQQIYLEVASKLWDCFRSNRRQCFSQSVRQLYRWATNRSVPDVILTKLAKLRNNLTAYSSAYSFPGCHRTSNMLERAMQRMDRFLFSAQYFHGDIESANASLRAWALIHNFAPFNPHTAKKKNFRSRAEVLNRFRYHDCWLQNLLISASLGGYRTPPHNPL